MIGGTNMIQDFVRSVKQTCRTRLASGWSTSVSWLVLALALPSQAMTQAATPPPAASQNPSPMAESTRAHERLVQKQLGGTARTFTGPGGKPVEVFIPSGARTRPTFDLVIHFHGAAWVAQQAADGIKGHPVTAVLNLGAGSGAYDRAFRDSFAFDSLLAGIAREVSTVALHPSQVGQLTLVGFSAGHGAIRAILLDPRNFSTVDAVLLLDGMHTSYIPEGKVLADQGMIDTTNLVAFTEFARAASRGEKRFIVTHSEIFPGTFASTTETADWMLGALKLPRKAVLRWGPRGMQQLSEVRAGKFLLMGFAGNSAPDHIDQLHAMPELLKELLKP